MARNQSFSEKFWHDKHGHFVAWQKPNVFLWVWIAATVVSIIMSTNSLERGISFIGGIAILIWAALELFRGVDYFRRTLGFCVILLFLVSHFIGGL